MNSNITRVVVSLVLGLTPLWAQSPREASGIRFRTFGWNLATDDLYYESKGQDTKVAIAELARSGFYEVAKEHKQIVFYRLVPGPMDKPLREEAATVNISGAGPWPLLIFIPNPDAPKLYRVAAIADDLTTFPFPSCRFVNFTMVELYAKYGDQQVTLAAQGVARLDPHLKSTTENETRYASVSMNTAEGPQVLYGSNWAARPTQRTLVFIFGQDGRIQIMRVSDDRALYAPPPQP